MCNCAVCSWQLIKPANQKLQIWYSTTNNAKELYKKLIIKTPKKNIISLTSIHDYRPGDESIVVCLKPPDLLNVIVNYIMTFLYENKDLSDYNLLLRPYIFGNKKRNKLASKCVIKKCICVTDKNLDCIKPFNAFVEIINLDH